MILLFTICFLIVYDLSYLYFIFFLPVFIVYVCLYAKNKLPAIATLIFLTLLGALRYIYYRAVDANFYHHAERLLPFAKMFYRFKMVIFKFTAPFYVFDQAWMNAHFKYIVMIAFLVIAIILVSAFTRNLDFHKRLKFTYFKNKKLKLAMVLLFFTVWAICTLITFLVASPAFLSYYVYIASFAINTIIVLLLYLLIDNFTRNKFILSLPCIVLIFVTGCVKIDESNKFNAQNNSAVKFLKNEINFLIMPDHSQIVVLNLPDKYTSISPGTWAKSMGIVKYVSQRTDLSGLIGREFTLYNPFEQKHEIIGWGNGMTGLSYKMPLFVFAYDNRNENLQQSEYFVVFTDSVHYNWKLFKLNKMDGSMTLRHEGAGLADYHALLKKEQDKLMNNVVWDDFL